MLAAPRAARRRGRVTTTPNHRRDPEAAIADWLDRPVGEVIDHILSRYHTLVRRQLAELRTLVVAAGLDDALAARVARFDDELSQHLLTEERVSFRMIRAAGGHTKVAQGVMVHEHLLIDRLLGELREALPEGVEGSLERAQIGALLAEIEADLVPHATLEELVFARSDPQTAG